MNVLFVTPNFPPDIGGVQTWSFQIARHLFPLCRTLTVIAPKRANSEEVDRLLPFQIVRIMDLGDNLLLSSISCIRSQISKNRPTVILVSHWSASFAATIARGKLLIPIVCAVHGREVMLEPLRWARPLMFLYNYARKRAYLEATILVAVSEFTAQLLRVAGFSEAQLVVVPNGVESGTFINSPSQIASREYLGLDKGLMILTTCRLVPRKGVDTVIRIMPQLLREVPQLHYVVVGSGPDEQRLRQLASLYKVEDHISWVGRVSESDLPLYYAACDVFVMPARSEPPDVEGFGISFLEAGAASKPSVALRAGGVTDAIVDGRTGILIDPHDDQGLTDAVVQLLQDEVKRKTMGNIARDFVVKERTWKLAAEKICNYIMRLS